MSPEQARGDISRKKNRYCGNSSRIVPKPGQSSAQGYGNPGISPVFQCGIVQRRSSGRLAFISKAWTKTHAAPGKTGRLGLFCPPIALVIGIFTGYLVHNPLMKQASVTYEQAFGPRVEHLKRSLRAIMDSETDQSIKLECATMITMLDKALERKEPQMLSQTISQAEFIVDWRELQLILLKLKENGALQGEALTEAQALWDSAQKKDMENFYKHRTRLFLAIKKTPENN